MYLFYLKVSKSVHRRWFCRVYQTVVLNLVLKSLRSWSCKKRPCNLLCRNIQGHNSMGFSRVITYFICLSFNSIRPSFCLICLGTWPFILSLCLIVRVHYFVRLIRVERYHLPVNRRRPIEPDFRQDTSVVTVVFGLRRGSQEDGHFLPNF